MLETVIVIPVGVIVAGFAYISLKFYLLDRQFAHIPGPKNEG